MLLIFKFSSSILLNIFFHFFSGKGPIYASIDPIVSACPQRCGAKTFCGPRIEIPTHMMSDCMEQYFEDQILTLEPYDENPNEDPQPSDADFVLFVDVVKDPSSRFVVSENAFCQLDLTTYRPIAGFLSFNVLALEEGSMNYDIMLAQVKHSLCHMLGFSLNIIGLSPTVNGFSYEK